MSSIKRKLPRGLYRVLKWGRANFLSRPSSYLIDKLKKILSFFGFYLSVKRHSLLNIERYTWGLFPGTFGGWSFFWRCHYFNFFNWRLLHSDSFSLEKNHIDRNNFLTSSLSNSNVPVSFLESLILKNFKFERFAPRPNLTELKFIEGAREEKKIVIMDNTFTPSGFYHFYLDVLPEVVNFKVNGSGILGFPYVEEGFQKEILQFLGLGPLKKADDLKLANTAIVSHSKSLVYPQASSIRLFSKFVTEQLHKQATMKPRKRRVFITRRDEKERRLLYEELLIEGLLPLGFEVFDPGKHDFSSQIDVFSNCEFIVAPHGAALSHLVCVPAGCCVVELNGDKDVRWHFAKISKDLGLNYKLITGRKVDSIYFEVCYKNVVSVIKDMLP